MVNDISILNEMEKQLEKKKKAEAILNEKETVKTFLDQGLHNGVWYYGRLHNGRNSVITSDRNCYINDKQRTKEGWIGCDEIREIFGLEYDNSLNDFAPMMGKDVAADWIREKEADVTIAVLFVEIKEKILYYMDFADQPETADVLACWIIASYHYSQFYWFPNLLFNAPKESGKTKCSDIVLQLSFKGYDIGAAAGATPAQLFRTIDMCRGTIRLDEYEKMDIESKKLSDQVLNAGVNQGAYVIRNEKIGNRFVPTKFPIYCPKIACNISGINSTSLTRFIAFKWLKTLSEKANRQPTSRKDIETFQPIRDKLYLYGLKHYLEVLQSYENVQLPPGMKGRQADNWKPIYAIANLVGEGVIMNVQKYVDSYKELDIDTNDPTEEFFEILFEIVEEKERWYGCKDIAAWEAMQDLLGFTKSPAHWIGRKLSLYKFVKKRSAGSNGYFLSKQKITATMLLYFNSTNSTISINSTNSTNSTNSIEVSGISGACEITRKKEVNCFDPQTQAWNKCDDCGNTPCNYVDGIPYCQDCIGKHQPVEVEEVK